MKLRISVNLFHYYQDHRQLTRLFLNDEVETINDLQKRIVQLFEIEDNFYLLCENHYLPPTEDIRLLYDDDIIYVVPSLKSKDRKHKKKKSKHIEIDENLKNDELLASAELEIKKSKKRRRCLSPVKNDVIDSNAIETEEKIEKPKKKVKGNKTGSLTEKSLKLNKSVVEDVDNEDISKQNKSVDTVSESVDKEKQNLRNIDELLNSNSTKNNELTTTKSKNSFRKAITLESFLLSIKASNESLDDDTPLSELNSKNRNNFRQESSIGHLLKSLNGSTESLSDENSLNNFITKRRRHRTRRRRQEKNNSNIEANSEQFEFQPPNTQVVPNSHIKFDNEKQEADLTSNSVYTHSTPCKKSISSKFTEHTAIKICDLNPEKLPKLTETPAVDDLILFKKLKMGQDYSPQLSNYILAVVKQVDLDQDFLKINIIEGHNELKEPNGKFSCISEEDENNLTMNAIDEIVCIGRNALIDAHLINVDTLQ